MVKSKLLAVLLMLGLANFSIYLPTSGISPCSCSKQQSCEMDHDCSHCATKNKAPNTSSQMCHSEAPPAVSKNKRHRVTHKSDTAKHRDATKTAKIFNPDCQSKTYSSFTLQVRKGFVVSEHFTYKQQLDRSFFTPTPFLEPEQVYLTLLDKPPHPPTILS